jgi:hypothetical protein
VHLPVLRPHDLHTHATLLLAAGEPVLGWQAAGRFAVLLDG